VVDLPKEVGTQLLQFSPRSKIVFFQKLDFLRHLGANEKSNWYVAGKVVVQDPKVVCIKGFGLFRFCKNSALSVWVFPLVIKRFLGAVYTVLRDYQ
jgi:hypothetical protein